MADIFGTGSNKAMQNVIDAASKIMMGVQDEQTQAAQTEQDHPIVAAAKEEVATEGKKMSSKEKMAKGLYNEKAKMDPVGKADADIDNDGVANALDIFPLDRFETLDTDKDGIGNNADKDDDGDGFADALDAFPLDATKSTFASGSSIQGLALPSAITVLETE